MLNKAILLASARRRPAPAAPFAPDAIPGLVLWLDADDASSVVRDGSNRVSQWSDKSGDAKHAVMANATYQPTYVAAAINGRGAIDFQNSKYLELPDPNGISGANNRSAFVVFEHFNATEQGYLIALGHFSTGASGKAWRFAVHSSGHLICEITGANFIFSTLSPGTSPSQAALIFDGSTIGDHWAYLDGSEEMAIGTSLVDTSSEEASISQQNRGGPGGFVEEKAFYGYIAEILVYNSALSTNGRQKVEGYLAHKWAIAGSLPVGHTYKLTAP